MRAKYINENLIGKRLKELRDEKSLTLVELQNEVGYSHSIISRWERGIYIPNVFAVIALSDFFGVSTDFILCKTDFA